MEEINTLQALLPRLRQAGNQDCIVAFHKEDQECWSCRQVAEVAQELAQGLVAAGVEPGEFIPVLAHNRPEWVVAALAIIQAGAAVSPLDNQITTETLERVLQDSQARFIFTTTEYLNRLEELDLETDLRSILLDVEPEDERGWQAIATKEEISLPTVEPEEIATLFYTSGTTGAPKGVPLTHDNLVFQLKAIFETKLVRDDDRVLLPLPMYHVYPFTVGILIPLANRVPVILPHSLTGPQLMRALREGEATIIIGVPRIYRAVYDGLEAQIAEKGKLATSLFQTGLKSSIVLRRRFGWPVGAWLFRPLRTRVGPKLRLLTSGGSALAPDLAWKLVGLGWQVGIGYGLTETSPMLTINLPGAARPRLASVGPPLSGVDIRIDPAAHPAEEEDTAQSNHQEFETGEILARGPNVFSGYRNLPEETDESFTEDGWFRTGDLGYQNDAGYLFIEGRVSTMIVLEGGKNLQPEPLEDIYEQHDFIREIGILYEDNQLAALIVPELEAINRQRQGNVQMAIREAINDRTQTVASHQRIADYAITSKSIDRTNLGKIRRHVLKKHYRQASQGTVEIDSQEAGPLPIEDMSEENQELLSHPDVRQVWDWLARHYSDRRLRPDTSPQLDLGVDSLEWLTLTLKIQELTGVELSDEAIGRISTVRDLLQEVQRAAEQGERAGDLSLDKIEELLGEEQKRWLRPLNPVQAVIAAVGLYLFQVLMRLIFRIKVHGLENLPAEENVVVTPNHRSMLDGPCVAAALPYHRLRQTAWVAGRDVMLSNPLMRLVTRLGRVLPINRYTGGTGRKEMALAVAALQQGLNLVWFPEGQLSPEGGMLPFKEGAGAVLHQHPFRVVPAYIQGTRQAMPYNASIPRPKPVTITFGRPCDPRRLEEEGEGDLAASRIVRALQERVAALEDEARPR